MNKIKWNDDNTITMAEPPKRPKKITGTKFAGILGTNRWSTPFQQWCEITRTCNLPFEDTIYTIAGKTIEPKQAEYMRNSYFMRNLVTPTERFGANYFEETHGDFFPNSEIFGGMWDYILVDDDGMPSAVLEMKTTKRVEDWANDVPEYYALQASLYAYLLGVEDVFMVCSLLDLKDYDHPELFEPSAKNTIIINFKLHERYPDFENLVKNAEAWWDTHVEQGISPQFDEKLDAEYLKILRTNNLSPDEDISALLGIIDKLQLDLDKQKDGLAPLEKELKTATDKLKEYLITQFRDGDTKVNANGKLYEWTLSKTEGIDIDKQKLKADGLLEKYSKPKQTYRLTKKEL